MTPLHSHYNNLTSITFIDNGSGFSIEYSAVKQAIKASLTVIACLGAGVGVYLAVEDAFRIGFLAICLLASIGVLALAVATHNKEKRKPPFMTFDASSDEIQFPRSNTVLKNASMDVGFSHERYRAAKGCNYELNYVFDDQRHPFLQNVTSLQNIAQKLEHQGFKVTYFDELEN